jgi:hypothetical protein
MTLYRVSLALLVLPGFALAACGDSGGSSSTGATTTVTASDPTTGPSTTPTTGATDTTPTTTAGPTTEGGTVSDSVGETTTTGVTTTGVTTGTTDPTTGAVSVSSTGDTSGTSGTTTDGTTGDTTTGLPCNFGDTMGMGDVEKSYLWVANSDQNTVSKVDTQKLLEIARYRTGPNVDSYGEDPSRTAVSLDGRFMVVNGRASGRTTMIAANLEDCVDANANGMIDTSQTKDDIRAWGTDECVRWSIVHPWDGQQTGGPRGVTWTPGILNEDTCKFEDPKVWVGYLKQFGTSHMARLDGLTGTLEETVIVPNWNVGDTSWGPYGAALDKQLNVWFTGLRGELLRINTANDPATLDRWNPPPATQSYGMTVDPDGDPWMAGCFGPVTTFDPVAQVFTAVAGQESCWRGIAADKDGSVWVAANGPCGVAQIDHKTNTLTQFHNLNPCSTPVGVSVDTEGFVWVVDEYIGAWKIDPDNPAAMELINIENDHYTYSDMTGGQLKSVILPQ